MSVLGSISSMLHQCVPSFSLSSVFAIMNGYLPELLIIAAWFPNLFRLSDGKNSDKIIQQIWVIYFFKRFLSLCVRNSVHYCIRSLLSYFVLALFCALFTFKSAISDSGTFFILLFFTFDLPNLNIVYSFIGFLSNVRT